MKAACEKGFLLATDLADYLVKKGLGFRQAHHAIGGLVRYCEDRDKQFNDLKLAEFKQASPLFEKDVYKLLSVQTSVASKNVIGRDRARPRSKSRSSGSKRGSGTYSNAFSPALL